MTSACSTMAQAFHDAGEEISPAPSLNYSRFDIFKGQMRSDGTIEKVRSVGNARVADGFQTFLVELKTFLNERFYLLPERNPRIEADYAILTREPSGIEGRRYFWNKVGEGICMAGANTHLVHLSFDLLGCENIYLNLQPEIRE